MARWAIWFQVGFAFVGLAATLADQGVIPSILFPPAPLFLLCLLSIIGLPLIVIKSGRRRAPGSGQIVEGGVTLVLAVATVFTLFPLLQ